MSYGAPQHPPPYGQPPYGQAPYPGYPPGMMPPPQPSGGWSCGLIAIVTIGVCGVLCCGGFGGLAYFGLQIQHAEAQKVLERDPAVKQHVGRIRNVKIVSQTFQDDGEIEYVIELIGDKGGAK